MPHILYLVHDLSDAAVRRRVIMLRAGGAKVTLAGFRRTAEPVLSVEGLAAIDLGRTEDGAFGKRIATMLRTGGRMSAALGTIKPDVVVARNLEMLAMACFGWARGADRPRIVYESLDIHRLLLRNDPVSMSLRAVERSLIRRAAMIVTSSPAFIRDYFRPLQRVTCPILLVENKVVELERAPVTQLSASLSPDQPRRIGWFGALRCRKSLDLLAAFSRQMQGRYEIVLRGRPACRELPDFDRFIAAEPYMRFEGPYRAEDLAAIYGEVDLTWAIDFFEEGLNSKWLLPNRLYEGVRHGSVPVAMAGTETARFLNDHRIGLVLREASPEGLTDLLNALDDLQLTSARQAVVRLDTSLLVCSRADCESFVGALSSDVPAATRLEHSFEEQAWI